MLARIVCLGLALTASVASAAPAPSPKAEPKLDAATLAKIRKLQMERRDTLKKGAEARWQEFQAGRGTLGALLKTAKLLLRAELDVATTAEQRLGAHAAYLKAMKKMDEHCKAMYEAGRMTAADYYEA